MSLILEALRKSEAERRRGEVPDLHGAPSPAAPPLRDGPPAWMWLGLAVAAAMILATAMWLARRALPASPAPELPVAAMGPAEALSIAAGGDPELGAEPIHRIAASPVAGDRAGGAPPAPAAIPLRDNEAVVAPIAAAATAAAARPSTPPTRTPASPQAAVPPIPSRAPAPTLPAPVVASALASTGEPVPAAAAAGSAPLRLSDLAAGQRQLLPPLKMSMHMWAPTQRFAIIDGARVSEGDRIGDAVVEEITVDGVVLAWQGQRLQIPTR